MSTSRKSFASVTVLVFAFLLSVSTQHAGRRAPDDGSRTVGQGAADPRVEARGDACGGSCDDDDACTLDTCVLTTCEHAPIECGDADACNGEETCDSLLGCQPGTPLGCDDGDQCNGLESCDPSTGCQPGTPLECNDSDPCNGLESCDPSTGCTAGSPLECYDGDACTTDVCEPFVGCTTATITCDDLSDCTDDHCDVTEGCVYTSNDGDGDGACPYDNCPEQFNPDQTDSDSDGLGDPCDPCATDPANDGDGDGSCAPDDNCPGDFNPDQTDSDKDGSGDACDPCPLDPANDADSDDSCADVDNCPTLYNPNQNDDDSDGIGNVCAPFRVDFSPEGSETVEGYVPDHGLPFEGWRGWGWDATLQTRERGQEIPQELDTFVFSRDARRFTAELPNGEYDVRVLCGDPVHAQGPQRVSANGESLLENDSTAAGGFVDRTTRVYVRNGRLDLSIGGSDGNTVLNWAEASYVPPGPRFLRSISFQSDEGDSAAGFEPDYGYEFDSSSGYGWDDEYESVTRGSSVPTVLDSFVSVSGNATWEIEVPAPGYYEVWLSVGDSLEAAGPHRVIVEGNPVVVSESTAAGQFLERHAGALVEDNYLTVEVGQSFGEDELLAPAGDGGATTINYVVVATASDDPDGDSVDNNDDVCPFADDPDQYDSDKDGVGDACDPDRDGDGTENPADVCPELYDPFQGDTDLDGRGDACDVCPEDPFDDSDGDGVCALADNCPDVGNPGQEDSDADGLGDACEVLRVNFGPPTAPTPDGFVADDGSPFDWFLGRGWSASMPSRDRRTAAPQELDTFVFTSLVRTWEAELPNGDYLVRASIGDAGHAQGPQRVVVSGASVFENRFLEQNEFDLGEVFVPVRNGRLELEIGLPLCTAASASTTGCLAVSAETLAALETEDGGGIDGGVAIGGYTTINWIEASPTKPPPGILRSFNFQPAASAQPNGTEVDSGDAFDLKRGFGWSAPVETRERGFAVPQVLDTFAFASTETTWEVELPNGFYRVFVSVGDARFPQGPQRVLVEGATLVNGESTAEGVFLERDDFVLVEDGRLTLQIGGGGGNTCLNYVTIQSEAIAALRK